MICRRPAQKGTEATQLDIRKDTRPTEPGSFIRGHLDTDTQALEPPLVQLFGHCGA